ncbi:MAG: signal peptide peptidase SppA [Candidatus Margulisiibacteriota bacterium]
MQFPLRFKKYLWALLWVGFITSTLQAQTLVYDTLKSGGGIRAYGMGGAYTAVAENGEGVFYNPAGYALPGLFYKTDNGDYQANRYASFTSSQLVFAPFEYASWRKEDKTGSSVQVSAIGFGRQGSKGVDWGITYKSINEAYPGAQNTGWSSDFGLLVHFNRYMNLGFTAKDVFKQNVAVPTTFTGGVALFNPDQDFTLTADLIYDKKEGQAAALGRVGAEYAISDGLTIRGGMLEQQLTGGLSIQLPFVEVNYAVVSASDQNPTSMHMLGFKIGRGGTRPLPRRQYTLFKSKAYAEFALGGNVTEGKSEISLMGGEKIGTNDLVYLIHQAANDPTCEGFVVRIGSLPNTIASVGMVQDIREELAKSKANGKKVIMYLDDWSMLPEYYLASVADKIVMPELGVISHLGLALELVKTKTFLNNFGIEPVVIANGAYKDNLLGTTAPLSASQRIVWENVVNSLYSQVLFDIKDARHLDWKKTADIFDGRLISAREALSKGLVDKLGFYDDALALVSSENEKPKVAQLAEFDNTDRQTFLFPSFNKIAVVEIDGMINLGQNETNFLYGGKGTGSDEISAITDRIKDDPTIKGVILRVNSPGGSVLASDHIYTAIQKLKKSGKMVYTSMGHLAASGGYYVSMNSDKIVANPGTLTGSIGVISMFQTIEGLHHLLGIDRDVIKTGKYMDLFSPNKTFTADEIGMIKKLQTLQYTGFTRKVSQNRSLTDKEVADVAQGQLFTGKQALDLKLVDKLGNFYDAVDDLAKATKIKGEPELVFFRKEDGLVSFLRRLGLGI